MGKYDAQIFYKEGRKKLFQCYFNVLLHSEVQLTRYYEKKSNLNENGNGENRAHQCGFQMKACLWYDNRGAFQVCYFVI